MRSFLNFVVAIVLCCSSVLSQDTEMLSRIPRSPFSPPTVTSMQPPRRGVSSLMFDGSLGAARQSEGPSHPSMMRKAPPRRHGTPFIVDLDNLSRPNIMFYTAQKNEPYEQQQQSFQSLPEETSSIDDLTVASHRLEDSSVPVALAHQTHADLNGLEIAKRSRQRRLDILHSEAGNRKDERLIFERRHGFEDPNSRHDTFGHEISEDVWTGLKRNNKVASLSAARGFPAMPDPPSNSHPSGDERKVTFGSGRWNPRFSGGAMKEESNTEDLIPQSNSGTPRRRGRGHAWFHRRKSEASSQNEPTPVNSHEQKRNHRRFQSGNRSFAEPAVETARETYPTLSLNDVMAATDQSYEELTDNLDRRGVSLAYLLRQLNNGAQMEEIVNLLNFSAREEPSTTTIKPITQTDETQVWKQLFHQELERTGESPENSSFSDPVYADGVYPVYAEPEDVEEFPSDDNQPMDFDNTNQFQEEYSEIEDDSVEDRATIHSFTVHELPWDESDQNPVRPEFKQADYLDYSSSKDPQLPYYNHFDQFQDFRPNHFAGNDVLVQPETESSDVLPEADATWSQVAEKRSSRPITVTVIAAGAIMAGLTIFTVFVLIAYTIIKCTKKTDLNNYQVDGRKENANAT